ncbi:MmcQ/YjbR family DNA-binding protein [Chryseobacterium culicis]|uniref:MmcQ/YjbR family DNA-binding protein n=1 Tax=Chryseobacterium culicis TaxID=680127 RepID=UPI00289BB9A7|nr:MmcQ/YjbR family DNA-binding protein [Chryseobacterium culicis]
MDIENFRAFCLSFPDTHEGMPFQGFFKNSRSILVFYVGKKMFCFFDIDKFDYCTLKCDPELVEKLRQHEGVEKPYNLSEKHWINVALNAKVPEEMIKDLVEKSYRLVAASISKKNT